MLYEPIFTELELEELRAHVVAVQEFFQKHETPMIQNHCFDDRAFRRILEDIDDYLSVIRSQVS